MRERRISWIAAVAWAALAVHWAAPAAPAVVTDFTVGGGSGGVVILGGAVRCTAVDDGADPIANYQWVLVFNSGTCASNPRLVAQGQGQNAVTAYAAYPGTYTMTLTVTYAPVGQPPVAHGPTTITKSAAVGAADGAIVMTNNGQQPWPAGGISAPNGTSIEVDFKLTSGGFACGPYVGGMAQERLTTTVDYFQGGTVTPPQVGLWVPDQPMASFELLSNFIADLKYESWNQNTWNAIPVGATLWVYTQEIRIQWRDTAECNAAVKNNPLAQTFTVTVTKDSATTYNVQVQ